MRQDSGSLNSAINFFLTHYHAYNNPASGNLKSSKAIDCALTIIDKLSEIPLEQFQALPLLVKVNVLKEYRGEDVEMFLDPPIAGLLIQMKIDDSLRKSCMKLICKWNSETKSLKIEGEVLIDQKSVEGLFESIPEELKQQTEDLDLSSCDTIDSLKSILKNFTALRSLKITGLYRLKTLEGIDSISTSLEELEAKNLFVLGDLTGLDKCIHLRKLDLSRAKILNDPRALISLVALEELTVNSCFRLKFLEVLLPKLPQLKKFSISNVISLTDVSFLASCEMLDDLDIRNTGVSSINPLYGMKKLRREKINTFGCPIKDM